MVPNIGQVSSDLLGIEGGVEPKKRGSAIENSYQRHLTSAPTLRSALYPATNNTNAVCILGTGATYYITDIYRLRRADGSEYLYTKGRVNAYNSLGDHIRGVTIEFRDNYG
jgi:hypothetical protein